MIILLNVILLVLVGEATESTNSFIVPKLCLLSQSSIYSFLSILNQSAFYLSKNRLAGCPEKSFGALDSNPGSLSYKIDLGKQKDINYR